LFIVFGCVVVLVLPAAVAVAVLLVLVCAPVAVVGTRRYRFIKSNPGYERPGNEMLFKDLEGHLPGRKSRGRDRNR
jgi:hypothetical protein